MSAHVASHSIASAKNHLPKLVHLVQDSPVVLTRRGKPVAVLQSYESFRAAHEAQAAAPHWLDAAHTWRREHKALIDDLNLSDELVDSWRSREMPVMPAA